MIIPGAFLGGLRVMAVDGMVLDVPDSPANARVFGYPGSRKVTRAAFPKVRLVLLIEAGTHLIVDALMCPYPIGERIRALKLLRACSQGMLLMWDRGLHSYREVVQEIYGWFLSHYAIRTLMFQAATAASISPLRLGFTGTLKVIRRAIADFQDSLQIQQ